MIYTVGLIEKYEAQLSTGRCIKHGQRPGYPGGMVWKTAEEAQAYLVLRNSAHNRRVYGILADWDADTIQTLGRPYRSLLRDAPVVRIDFSPVEASLSRASSVELGREIPAEGD